MSAPDPLTVNAPADSVKLPAAATAPTSSDVQPGSGVTSRWSRWAPPAPVEVAVTVAPPAGRMASRATTSQLVQPPVGGNARAESTTTPSTSMRRGRADAVWFEYRKARRYRPGAATGTPHETESPVALTYSAHPSADAPAPAACPARAPSSEASSASKLSVSAMAGATVVLAPQKFTRSGTAT